MSIIQRVAVIDCQIAGVSGDMLVGALLDIGASIPRVVDAMESIEVYAKSCKNLHVAVHDVNRRGMRAKKVNVEAEELSEMTGSELVEITMRCLEGLNLTQEAKQFASESINSLLFAEAKVHGESVGGIRLHETGSVDTVADIVGTTVAAEELGLFKARIYSTPVAVGGGQFSFSHGTITSPAPATIELLRSKGFLCVGGPVESELVTPTGAALLVNLAHESVHFYPMMRPKLLGYGAGTRDFVEMPNVLRITLGEPLDHQPLRDEISVLETNVDDVTGETIGHVVDKLLQEGAKDVSIIPMFTKKNRPGQILKIIADKTDAEHLIQILMRETGTLGVRIYPCERHILNRETIQIEIILDDVKEMVNVKVAKDGRGEILQIKPEYDDVRRVAEKTGRPMVEIMELAKMKARGDLLKR